MSMGSVIATSGKQKGEYLPFGQRINVIGRDKVFPLQALDALVLLKYWRLVILQMIINGALLALSTIATPYTVYPQSNTITGIRFRMDTVKHCAPGNNKCAFESDNWAIKGVAWANEKKGRHIITSAIEHHAVLEPCEHLAKHGWDLTVLSVSPKGLVDPDDVKKALRKDTVLVSIMHANNEIGVIEPISEIAVVLEPTASLRLLRPSPIC